jgi:hypothetical protein
MTECASVHQFTKTVGKSNEKEQETNFLPYLPVLARRSPRFVRLKRSNSFHR